MRDKRLGVTVLHQEITVRLSFTFAGQAKAGLLRDAGIGGSVVSGACARCWKEPVGRQLPAPGLFPFKIK